MRRIVLTFGLIAGAILVAMMFVTVAIVDNVGFEGTEALGYTSMVLAFLMVYFGIRSYRDNVVGGAIGFGRAFGVGILIMLVASACYVAAWEVIYYKVVPDFGEKYAAHMLDQARAEGATEAELAAKTAELRRFAELYRNPFFNAGVTFLEPLPVGLIMTLVSAGILRRPRKTRAEGAVGGVSVAV